MPKHRRERNSAWRQSARCCKPVLEDNDVKRAAGDGVHRSCRERRHEILDGMTVDQTAAVSRRSAAPRKWSVAYLMGPAGVFCCWHAMARVSDHCTRRARGNLPKGVNCLFHAYSVRERVPSRANAHLSRISDWERKLCSPSLG